MPSTHSPQTILTIEIADIAASGRLRPVDPDHVELIAASIEENGLLAPISVRASGDKWRLVTGAHRLAAMAALGWTQLNVGTSVLIADAADDLEAEIAEIDENLCRHNLNALDRALFIAKRRELCAERRQAHGGDRKSQKVKEKIKSARCQLDLPPRFTLEVAEKVGMSERLIRRDLRIAENLDQSTIAKLRGTKIERNQQQLLMLCDMEASDQFKCAVAIKDGQAKTVTDARIAIGLDKAPNKDPQPRLLATLMESWERASKITRATFLAGIGAEIVKRRPE